MNLLNNYDYGTNRGFVSTTKQIDNHMDAFREANKKAIEENTAAIYDQTERLEAVINEQTERMESVISGQSTKMNRPRGRGPTSQHSSTNLSTPSRAYSVRIKEKK